MSISITNAFTSPVEQKLTLPKDLVHTSATSSAIYWRMIVHVAIAADCPREASLVLLADLSHCFAG